MAAAVFSRQRVSVDGKFFRLGDKKFYVKGVAYGPFPANAAGQPFASPEQTAADFAQIRELGANLVRVYHVPGKWFLDLAEHHKLKVLVDNPWNKHLCFLDSAEHRAGACDTVRRAVQACGGHPAVFAFSVANEVPPDVVRWSGARAVGDFIDELIQVAKRADPQCLCTFTNYPPTEFLRPQGVDFVCFNVYLHNRQPFRNYLARLQMQAESKPLLLGEFGADSLREGEARKCEMLEWQIQDSFLGGLAGAVVFSFTDEWINKDGHMVKDWQMGLTTHERKPKPSFATVQKMFHIAPRFPLPRAPKVTVVVAAFNAARTLSACLDSLQHLSYPDYEVIVVDDGSTDETPEIVREALDVAADVSRRQSPSQKKNAPTDVGGYGPQVRYIRHPQNLGLSAARNSGIGAASGEIIAFTDADCRADEDWLYYLVSDLLGSDFAGMGGPNLLPPEDSPVAAAVMASPGGPAHVMLTDRQAEHIPGCNMSFYRWALAEAGGFDPIFRRAGDDVDLCWRVQQAGYKIGFSAAAFVWHYRRSTVPAYLKQQHGYGEAEALLVRKHPEYFNGFGGSLWHGRIYAASRLGVLLRPPIIYRGLFGSAGFQSLYASAPALDLMFCTSLEFHVLVTLPLWVLSAIFHIVLPLAITSLLISLGVCAAAGAQAGLPKNKERWWSRPMVAALYFLQPIVRGWARYQGRLTLRPEPLAVPHILDSVALREGKQSLDEVAYWAEQPVDRLAWVADILRRMAQHGWPNKSDIGWSEYDVEVYGSRWSYLQLTTVAEEHPPGKQILRCRLRARWSLPAKVAFCLLCGLELAVIRVAAARGQWWWLVALAAIPLFVWFLQREKRTLQSLCVVFLDHAAKEWKMSRV